MKRGDLIEMLKPYGEPLETPEGVLFEMVDEESGTYDRIAIYTPDIGQETVMRAFLQAIEDLTDHDIPGRNVFAFGFRPDFEGTVMEVSFRSGKGGVLLGRVPERIVEIAKRNRIPFERGDGKGILLNGSSGEDVDVLTKLIEAVVFEW
ncbi:hypothetical protein [Thermococcus sp.]|uniref:hypothetical protein n=1 Tax=Thermococcus sp. TaxID=35749 RepID=UPI0026392382|nr:hypothetical protein [Thermococcus sp.]